MTPKDAAAESPRHTQGIAGPGTGAQHRISGRQAEGRYGDSQSLIPNRSIAAHDGACRLLGGGSASLKKRFRPCERHLRRQRHREQNGFGFRRHGRTIGETSVDGFAADLPGHVIAHIKVDAIQALVNF
jgi:hypothetical protein